jgi:hypothetical protein
MNGFESLNQKRCSQDHSDLDECIVQYIMIKPMCTLMHDWPLCHFAEGIATVFRRDVFSRNMMFSRDSKPFLCGSIVHTVSSSSISHFAPTTSSYDCKTCKVDSSSAQQPTGGYHVECRLLVLVPGTCILVVYSSTR